MQPSSLRADCRVSVTTTAKHNNQQLVAIVVLNRGYNSLKSLRGVCKINQTGWVMTNGFRAAGGVITDVI